MGAITITRRASGNLNKVKLADWFRSTLSDMASEGGTDSYCGNWNCNKGLRIVDGSFTAQSAAAYAEENLERRGSVFALQVGDFSKVWPVTKAQKDTQDRLVKLETEVNEFDYRILERAQKQTSKTKKCSHCESSINVHKILKPDLKELTQGCGRFDGGLSFEFGRYLLTTSFGMTDCPVCSHNLLKTDTDTKTEASLKTRYKDARDKESKSRQALALNQAGKAEPYWYVIGECAC